jgi:hypothetical protein
MLKNITLSADERLIALARAKAQSKNETLDSAFRKWLLRYVKKEIKASHYANIMEQFDYVNVGKQFTRDELDER